MTRFNQAFFGLLLSQVSLGLASPSQEPCAQVAAAQQKQWQENPEAPNFTVSAGLAQACLASVPFKSKDALELIDGLGYFWDWQTTKDYVRNPPRGYLLPPTDLDGGLRRIRHKAARNGYKGELEFQLDLDTLVRSVHDGHFNLGLDLITTFEFRRSELGPLVSISENGRSFPKVYSLYDLQGRAKKPSAIRTIDGENAAKWLTEFSFKGSFQDPDALFNGVLYTLPRTRVSGLGSFLTSRAVLTGAKTSVRFENRTTMEYDNFARSSANFTGVTDGKSFYEKFCTPSVSAASLSSSSEKHSPFMTADPGFESTTAVVAPRSNPDLEPIRESTDGAVAGYFLKGERSNVAVLYLRNFVGFALNADPLWEYSDTVTKFLADCREAKKEKLIIDVSGNRGGTIFLGYDTFKQLLPEGKIETPFNLRAIEQFDIIGTKVNRLLDNPSDPKAPAAERERNDIFDINSYVDVDGKKFDSWADYFGPEKVGRFKFANLAYWDFHNEEMSLKAGGLIVSGYGNRSDVAPQAFKTENMVLVTDGICASTCAIFADLLNRNGVKSIATGGHGRFGPMQAVGGVKGTQVLTFRELWDSAQRVFAEYSTPEEQQKLKNTQLGKMISKGKYVLERLLDGGHGGRVNYRNAVYPDDKDRVPRQYVYEPAHCRMWLTKEALLDTNRWWTTLANDWWGRKSRCVFGSRPKA
ncbi:predicted protein [Uncinocarpus reesii 1704]|uniref:Uncharacterized protein n=1 Tax=Uncinocarpus reesii (strain UAMH 1704) TaxID=336963 RepID=C4JN44_UNCRE|nr:uncharacterized protein UREG_04252 [Uncinocarpus reesii 1704]EEP79406.1 predicted protein [Uncinocarpus reesii 1704]